MVFFYFFPRLTCLAVFGRFQRQKWNFEGPKFWLKKNMFFSTLTNLFRVCLKSPQKTTLLFNTISPLHLQKSRNYDLVIFRRFFNFGPFFGPFSGTAVKNVKHEKVAPEYSLIKILASILRSLKYVFLKCTFLDLQLNWLGLVWYLLNSLKALASHRESET